MLTIVDQNKVKFGQFKIKRPVGRGGNAFVSGTGGLRFKSRAGQIGHSVANGSPPLQHFFERSRCASQAQ